jgi:Domain of unknown function (DUF5658)
MIRNIHSWSLSKKIALALLVTLQIGDAISTFAAMSVHGVIELNPLLRGATGGADIHKTLLAKLFLIAVSFLLISRAKTLWRVWITCGVCSAIVVSNALLFATHQ